MKAQIQELREAALSARQNVSSARTLFVRLETQAKTAKAKSRHLKAEYKRARAAAKKAKRLVLEAQEDLRVNTQLLLKAEKRLAKASRKEGKRPPPSNQAANPARPNA